MRNTHSLPRFLTILIRLLLLFACLAPLGVARADTGLADIGPKPGMTFEFQSETGEPIRIVSGELLQCDQPDCSDAQPLQQLGPQHFSCEANTCSSLSYGYSDYNRIRITFEDGRTLESNVFDKRNFDAVYNVTVRADSLLVEEQTGPLQIPGLSENIPTFMVILLLCACALLMVPVLFLVWMIVRSQASKATFVATPVLFILTWVIILLVGLGGFAITWALPLTMLIEGLVAAAWAAVRKHPVLPLVTALSLANLLSLPALTAAIVFLGGPDSLFPFLAIGELFVFLFEALIIWLTQNRKIGFGEAALISLVANLVSFVLGLVLPVG